MVENGTGKFYPRKSSGGPKIDGWEVLFPGFSTIGKSWLVTDKVQILATDCRIWASWKRKAAGFDRIR
jgi:hypothetical protein